MLIVSICFKWLPKAFTTRYFVYVDMERERHVQFCLPAFNDLLKFLFQYCLLSTTLVFSPVYRNYEHVRAQCLFVAGLQDRHLQLLCFVNWYILQNLKWFSFYEILHCFGVNSLCIIFIWLVYVSGFIIQRVWKKKKVFESLHVSLHLFELVTDVFFFYFIKWEDHLEHCIYLWYAPLQTG